MPEHPLAAMMKLDPKLDAHLKECDEFVFKRFPSLNQRLASSLRKSYRFTVFGARRGPSIPPAFE